MPPPNPTARTYPIMPHRASNAHPYRPTPFFHPRDTVRACRNHFAQVPGSRSQTLVTVYESYEVVSTSCCLGVVEYLARDPYNGREVYLFQDDLLMAQQQSA